jgi:WD40 repeat protein
LGDGVIKYERSQPGTQLASFWQQFLDLFKLSASSPALPFGRSVAFLVGVGNYKYLTPRLEYVKTDLAEFRGYLLSQGGFDTVYVAEDNVASASLVEEYMFNRLRKDLSSEDRLLFYFSGHGADMGGDVGYLQFADAQQDVYDVVQYLPVTRVLEWSRLNRAKHMLFLLDSCTSGLGFKEKAGPPGVDQALLSTFSGNGSRFVVTAGTAREKSFEAEGYSVFTRAFLDALRSKTLVSRDRGFVILEEVFADAKIRVGQFSARNGLRMTPRLWSIPRDESKDTGTFVFLNPGATEPKLAKPLEKALNVVVPKAMGISVEPARPTGEPVSLSVVEHQRRSDELAMAALDNLTLDPEKSLVLGLYSVSATYSVDRSVTREAESTLHRAIRSSRERLVLPWFAHAARRIVFSPDGKFMAAVGPDGKNVKVWETDSDKVITIETTSEPVIDIAFLPNSTDLVIACTDGKGKVWNVPTGRVVQDFAGLPAVQDFAGLHEDLLGIAISPDAKLLAARAIRTVRVIDFETGKELYSIPQKDDAARGADFSADGKYLVTAGGYDGAQLWDARTGKAISTLAGGALWQVRGVKFSPDGWRVAILGPTLLIVSQVRTGNRLAACPRKESYKDTLVFSPDGIEIATSNDDGAMEFCDSNTGRQLMTLHDHNLFAPAAAFTPSGKYLATSGDDGTVRLWYVGPDEELRTITGPETRNGQLAFSLDGNRLATLGIGPGNVPGVTVWDTASARRLGFLSDPPASSIAYSPDGKYLVTVHPDGTAIVWDAGTGVSLHVLSKPVSHIIKMAFSPDGKTLATASKSPSQGVTIWNVATGTELRTLSIQDPYINCIAYSGDGKRLALVGGAGVTVWDTETWKPSLPLPGADQLTYSPDGKFIATLSFPPAVELWDSVSGKKLRSLTKLPLDPMDFVKGVAFAGKGERVVVLHENGSIVVFDSASGNELFTLPGDPGEHVISFGFSAQAKRLAVDVMESGGQHFDVVRVFCLDVDDLIQLARSRVTRPLTPDECKKYLDVETCPPLP